MWVNLGMMTSMDRHPRGLGARRTGAGLTADSTGGGQEQGDQKRLNGLMSLAQKRTAERDAALAEIEELREMLAAASVVPEEQRQPTQSELMYPERYAVDETDLTVASIRWSSPSLR